jgi:hypothetical protein
MDNSPEVVRGRRSELDIPNHTHYYHTVIEPYLEHYNGFFVKDIIDLFELQYNYLLSLFEAMVEDELLVKEKVGALNYYHKPDVPFIPPEESPHRRRRSELMETQEMILHRLDELHTKVDMVQMKLKNWMQ